MPPRDGGCRQHDVARGISKFRTELLRADEGRVCRDQLLVHSSVPFFGEIDDQQWRRMLSITPQMAPAIASVIANRVVVAGVSPAGAAPYSSAVVKAAHPANRFSFIAMHILPRIGRRTGRPQVM
jgi:hypothetical protein